MAKQTMAFPYHNFRHRWDNKIYRLNTPQSPIVRTVGQDKFSVDDFPTGTNAVVAVISYTGIKKELRESNSSRLRYGRRHDCEQI